MLSFDKTRELEMIGVSTDSLSNNSTYSIVKVDYYGRSFTTLVTFPKKGVDDSNLAEWGIDIVSVETGLSRIFDEV